MNRRLIVRTMAAIVATGASFRSAAAAMIGKQMTHAQDARLRLVDAPYVCDQRPLTIESVDTQSLPIAGKNRDTTRVVAFYQHASSSRLRTVGLWHTPSVPFGVAKYGRLSAVSIPSISHS